MNYFEYMANYIKSGDSGGGTAPDVAERIAQLEAENAQLSIDADPWILKTDVPYGTDALGKYAFSPVGTAFEDAMVLSSKLYATLKPGVSARCALRFPTPAQTFVMLDLSAASVELLERCTERLTYESHDRGTQTTYSLFLSDSIKRLILPEVAPLKTYFLQSPPDYIYLPKHATKNQSSWVQSTSYSTPKSTKVLCPVGTDIPFYLNKFNHITAEDIVGIFENMVDRSSETTVATITLGSANLAKLTEEQIEIAESKGWSLA